MGEICANIRAVIGNNAEKATIFAGEADMIVKINAGTASKKASTGLAEAFAQHRGRTSVSRLRLR